MMSEELGSKGEAAQTKAPSLLASLETKRCLCAKTPQGLPISPSIALYKGIPDGESIVKGIPNGLLKGLPITQHPLHFNSEQKRTFW